MVNKILFITLSNIGDCILTLPALDALRANFPEAKITVLVGVRPKEIFENNPEIACVIIYNKQAKLKEKIKLFLELKKEKFDLVIDLRNSFFGAFLPAKYKTPFLLIIPKQIRHMKDRHLYRLQEVTRGYKRLQEVTGSKTLHISLSDEEYINQILVKHGITEKDKIVVVSAGARSHIKRWGKDKFVQLCLRLLEDGFKIILAGDRPDLQIGEYIQEECRGKVLNLCSKTNILQLAALLKRSRLLITNDSATLHLASYLDIPVLAIFGPTDDKKYGPWSGDCAVVKKEIFCRPCERAQCKFKTLECMQLIKVEDVLRVARDILATRYTLHATRQKDDFKRILIVRTDRIGDVILSTPVIKNIRDNFPNAYVAMIVSPYAKEIVEGNPYLDEVIIYDKDGRHKSWLGSIKFAANLKKNKFDLAIILHPTNRAHLITFFAGIRRRIGYNQKMGFLLTDGLKHTKHLGEKHELEYNLDLLRHLGINPLDKNLFMPIKQESEFWVEELFRQEGINKTDKLLAIHPGASCPSKIWPQERFAQAADRLAEKYGFKVLIIAGPRDIAKTEVILKNSRSCGINLAGRTSVSCLASILKRCRLFISNDSGPVHIASAVGTPVISIFGRSQKGLSHKRWGPLGIKDRVLHKDIGCIECLAHNCTKEFQCLKAITVDDVLSVADAILGQI